MASRTDLVQILAELIAWGADLIPRTNRRFAADSLPTPSMAICSLASAVHRHLKTIQLLEPYHLDDQMAPHARFIVEATIYSIYLDDTTIRDGKPITPTDKATLFNDAFRQNLERTLRSGLLKKRDLCFDVDEQAVMKLARAERDKVDIKRSVMWHASTTEELVTEIADAHSANPGLVKTINGFLGMFGYLSQRSHPGPQTVIYEPMKIGDMLTLSDVCDQDLYLGYALCAAILIVTDWAKLVSEETEQASIDSRCDSLVKRLKSEAVDN